MYSVHTLTYRNWSAMQQYNYKSPKMVAVNERVMFVTLVFALFYVQNARSISGEKVSCYNQQ